MRRVLALLSLLALTGCGSSKPEVEIKGNIFVVTNGAQNVKLGLVDVVAIPEKEINLFLDQKKISAEDARSKYKQAYDVAAKEYEAAEKEAEWESAKFDSLKNKADNTLDKMRAATGSLDRERFERAQDEAQGVASDMDSSIARLKSLRLTALDKQIARDKAKAQVDLWPTAEFYFVDIPTGTAKAVTDADGNFSIKLPAPGKYVLAAHSSRLVGDNKEHYYWMIKIDANGKPMSPIMLTNNNLMNTDAAENTLKVASLYY